MFILLCFLSFVEMAISLETFIFSCNAAKKNGPWWTQLDSEQKCKTQKNRDGKTTWHDCNIFVDKRRAIVVQCKTVCKIFATTIMVVDQNRTRSNSHEFTYTQFLIVGFMLLHFCALMHIILNWRTDIEVAESKHKTLALWVVIELSVCTCCYPFYRLQNCCDHLHYQTYENTN